MLIITARNVANQRHQNAIAYMVMQVDYPGGMWDFDICPITEVDTEELEAAKEQCPTIIGSFDECEDFVRSWQY
jgi:hypothetical protein